MIAKTVSTVTLMMVLCQSSLAATIEITGGKTYVQLDANVLRQLGLEVTAVSGVDLLSMPGLFGLPINSRDDATPTTFVYDSENLAPFSGTFEHTGTITFNNGTTVGDFQIAYSDSRPENTSGFFVRNTLSAEEAENIPLFDAATISNTPEETTVDFGTDFFHVDGPLLASPELAAFLGDETLTGHVIGAVKMRAIGQAVPEPHGVVLFLFAVLGLIGYARRIR